MYLYIDMVRTSILRLLWILGSKLEGVSRKERSNKNRKKARWWVYTEGEMERNK